jgi:hypothetical protein
VKTRDFCGDRDRASQAADENQCAAFVRPSAFSGQGGVTERVSVLLLK